MHLALCHPALEPVMSPICDTVLENNHCDLTMFVHKVLLNIVAHLF